MLKFEDCELFLYVVFVANGIHCSKMHKFSIFNLREVKVNSLRSRGFTVMQQLAPCIYVIVYHIMRPKEKNAAVVQYILQYVVLYSNIEYYRII